MNDFITDLLLNITVFYFFLDNWTAIGKGTVKGIVGPFFT